MKRTDLLAITLTVATTLTAGADPEPVAMSTMPTNVLRRADEARGNVAGIIWRVTVESKEGTRATAATIEVKARGFDVLATHLAPPKQKGNRLLMVNRNMWFYKPGLSKPVPISQRQKLMGNAAYGDIASTNYAEDYEAKRLPDEAVDGIPCYVFDLRARDKKTTYDRIKYWIAQDRLVGIKAEYFTVSGKRFKSAVMVYDHTIKIDGRDQPFISLFTIRDELVGENVTTMAFESTRIEAIPNHVFNLNLLTR